MKAYSYMRCSGDGQKDGDTWERQRKAIFAYALQNRVDIIQEFRDEGVPGKTEMLNRPGLANLLSSRLVGSDVKLVIIEVADRLARDIIVNELIIREFQSLGVRVVCASGGVDLTSGDDDNPTAKLIRQILAAVAEFDRCVIVNKTRAARERLRAQNGKCEGRKAYGTWKGEEETLKEILSMAAVGYPPTKISRILNNMGYRTRYGKPWNSGTIYRIIERQNLSPESPDNGKVAP